MDNNLSQNISTLNQGCTSSSFTAPHLFIKYIIKYQEHDVYEREKFIASKLKNFD